jgi:RNA polymerase sigma-70 factor (ECF subfamily)
VSGDAALPADEFRGFDRAAEAESPAALHVVASAPAAESDSVLLARARAGDRAAFGTLVERHHRSLAAILRSRCGPDVPIEDLLQEVFARTLANVDSFRGGSSYLTWATSVGLNLATDWLRTSRRRKRLAPTVDVDDADPPSRDSDAGRAAAERSDDAERARRALDRLPDPMRVAVTLRVVEDESYEEIAARMKAPMPRVRQWVCRGLKRLRESLESRGGGV